MKTNDLYHKITLSNEQIPNKMQKTRRLTYTEKALSFAKQLRKRETLIEKELDYFKR